MAQPSLGCRGYRVLDGLRFDCEVVCLSTDLQMLSVRYLDDGTIEHDVELDEFEAEATLLSGDKITVSFPPTNININPKLMQALGPEGAVLGVVASFLEPFERIAKLGRVSRQWRDTIHSRSLWRTLRVRSRTHLIHRLLTIPLDDNACVCDEVETIALDASDVTDDQVVSLVSKCPRLRFVSLQRCQCLSFMVVYEILRLSRERHAAKQIHLESLDLWLCRGISPTFVTQLMTPQRSHPKKDAHRRHVIQMHSPGFFFVDVDTSISDALGQLAKALAGWPTPTTVMVEWFQESTLIEAIDQHCDDPLWQPLQRHVPLLKAASLAGMVPLIRCSQHMLGGSEGHVVIFGIPSSTVQDLTRLIKQFEPHEATRRQLFSSLNTLVAADQSTTEASEPHETPAEDPLTAQAERVFALLRQTTEQLQDQVDRLENQVAVMTEAKLAAEREYKHAQRELQRVAHEADRAVLSLAISSDPVRSSSLSKDHPSSSVEPPPVNGVIRTLPDDTLLPPLPSSKTIKRLAESLEHRYFAVLDGFVGASLSSRVREDVEVMYVTSRAIEASATTNPPPAPVAAAHFSLGELAGGNTGRNLRYQMAHVRGDYMLWLDEHDAFCPPSIRLVLRQLDRLILERLGVVSHELSMSALLRKKAMVTCYPGKLGARYTRHCDNPNRNGRKLTAILYLNPDWDAALHGGELQLHLDGPAHSMCIAPVLDRLLLFFSDTRVPHEVLRCKHATRDRFALTVWYLDYDEYMHAQVFGAIHAATSEATERRRIENEIEKLRLDATPTAIE